MTTNFPERDAAKSAEQQGIFRKFIVNRVDGSDLPGGKHHGCAYFVLDMDHDPHAAAALRAYADSCSETHPQLAADLRTRFPEPQNGEDGYVCPAGKAQRPADLEKDAARYRWLRDGKSAYGGWGGTAPRVIDPGRSRLYAVQTLAGNPLDISVDSDMLHTKAQRLHESNEVVERGLMPPGASRLDTDGPYSDALYKLAKEELGFTDAQFNAVMQVTDVA